MSTFNTSTTTPTFDNLLLKSLLNRLNLHPPPPSSAAPTTSFDDFLSSLSDEASDYDDASEDDEDGRKTRLSKEESRLEKDIVKVILSGKTDTLKPNSGQAVSIGDHHVCVGFHEEDGGSGYRVWEWHGHVMLFDDDVGYSPEYIYGNYFERVVVGAKRASTVKPETVEKEKEKEKESVDLGLKGLIDAGDDDFGSRVVHRGRNAGVKRDLKGTSEK